MIPLFGNGAARHFRRAAPSVQTAQSRRPPHHRLIAQMPPKAKNAIAPMTSHMMMLFIVHLRFVSSKGPIPPDAAHYALFPLPRLLEIQRKPNSAPIAATPHRLIAAEVPLELSPRQTKCHNYSISDYSVS